MRPAADRHATGVFGKRYQYNCCVSYPVRIGRAEVFGAKFLAELAPPIYVVVCLSCITAWKSTSYKLNETSRFLWNPDPVAFVMTNYSLVCGVRIRQEKTFLKYIINKTGSRQCTRAVWSTFAKIHSTHPGALMHYSRLEFHFKVKSRGQRAIQIPGRQSRVQSMFTQVTERP